MILSLLLLACSSGSKDSGEPVDTEVPSACDSFTLPTADIAIDPDGPLTQIHPWAAWDGEGVRLVWNRPDDDGNFDVFTTRVALDGTVLDAASVDEDMPGNHTYPRIAANGADALAVWQTDNQAGSDNLDLNTRLLGADTQHLEPLVGGVPVTGNAWMPSIAADSTGGWQVAAAVAVGPTFQTLIQPLDATGNPEGDALIPARDDATSQYNPSLSVAEDGSRLVAWEEWDKAGATYVRVARYPSGADTPETVSTNDDGSGLPSTAWPFVAFHQADGSEYDIVVQAGDASIMLGEPGELDHSAAVASRGDAALVAWLRVESGIRNSLVLQELAWTDGSLVPGEPWVLDTVSDVAPYPLTVVPVCDGAWFVAWVEGDSPDFVVKGRFI